MTPEPIQEMPTQIEQDESAHAPKDTASLLEELLLIKGTVEQISWDMEALKKKSLLGNTSSKSPEDPLFNETLQKIDAACSQLTRLTQNQRAYTHKRRWKSLSLTFGKMLVTSLLWASLLACASLWDGGSFLAKHNDTYQWGAALKKAWPTLTKTEKRKIAQNFLQG